MVSQSTENRHTSLANYIRDYAGYCPLNPEFDPDIGRAYNDHAVPLAQWVQSNIVNRDDAYGVYAHPGPDVTTFKRDEALTQSVLVRHFSGLNGYRGERIGLYSYGTDGQGRWVVLDIDAHSAALAANWLHVLTILHDLRGWGVEPIVDHSNGKCGFKIWVIFDRPLPAAVLRSIGLYLCCRLPELPEIFPKQAEPTAYGNYVRLPGRHHRNPNWHSQFFDTVRGRWVRGKEAPEYLATRQPNSPDLIPAEARDYAPPPPTRATSNMASGTGTGSGESDYSRYTGDLKTLDIVALVEDAGLYHRRSGPWHEILCPWRHEHTTGEYSYVIEAEDGGWPGWHCKHSHCVGRKLADFLATFDAATVDEHCAESFGPSVGYDESEVAATVGTWPVDLDLSDWPAPADDTGEDLWGTYDGLEMIRRSRESKTDFLFDGLLETGVITLFSGLPYSGKSLVVLQLMKALAKGEPFYGRDCWHTGTPVLYVNADRLRDRQFERRLAGICGGDEADLLTVAGTIHFTEVADLPATVSSDYLGRLIRGVKRRHETDKVLVVIDTLRPAFLMEQGPGAENDPSVITQLLSPIRQLAGETNSPVLLLHHNNRSRDDYSGSAAIAGTTEAVWTIKKLGDHSAEVEVQGRDCANLTIDVVLGQPPEGTVAAAVDELTKFVLQFPASEAKAWTRAQAEANTGLTGGTLRRRLDEAQDVRRTPRLVRSGTGTRESPYRFHQTT